MRTLDDLLYTEQDADGYEHDLIPRGTRVRIVTYEGNDLENIVGATGTVDGYEFDHPVLFTIALDQQIFDRDLDEYVNEASCWLSELELAPDPSPLHKAWA